MPALGARRSLIHAVLPVVLAIVAIGERVEVGVGRQWVGGGRCRHDAESVVDAVVVPIGWDVGLVVVVGLGVRLEGRGAEDGDVGARRVRSEGGARQRRKTRSRT